MNKQAAKSPAKRAKPRPAPTTKRKKPSKTAPSKQAAAGTKLSQLIGLLRTAKGITIAQAATALGWQVHSVRGVLSGTIKKKLGLSVLKSPGADGVQHYRLAD